METGNRIIQTGNGIISSTSWPPIKNFFYKKFLTFKNESKTGFENRKYNYLNRKWKYFSYFLTSNQKTYFTKDLSLLPRFLKMVFKTGNGIIQTGNGIISPNYWPLIKKLIIQKVANFYNGVQNWCWKEETELSKQEMELFLLFPDHWSKNLFYKMFITFISKLHLDFNSTLTFSQTWAWHNLKSQSYYQNKS